MSAVAYSLRKDLNAEAVEVVGLYWHFVDIVWVVIFAIVYLIP
jgi:heme/copper-type cytochrome/quinol oxidase subunit 3